MPELPEIQALPERLHEFVGGEPLTAAEPLQFSALKTADPPAATLAGRSAAGVTRRGKFLVFDFEGPRILVHLGQGGRVEVEQPPKRTRPKGAIVRMSFGSSRAVLVREYGTQRKAGWWVLPAGDEGPLARLGPEPYSEEFALWVMESNDRRRLHTSLRDQRTVAGIGRGYADDILNRAGLSPYATLVSMSREDRARLMETVRAVLSDALAKERTRTGGLPTKMGGRFAVHGRSGEPCPRCGTQLRRISYEDYEIVYCTTCQTDGKALADRRLSRLIR